MSKIVDLKAPMNGYLFRFRLKTSMGTKKKRIERKEQRNLELKSIHSVE